MYQDRTFAFTKASLLSKLVIECGYGRSRRQRLATESRKVGKGRLARSSSQLASTRDDGATRHLWLRAGWLHGAPLNETAQRRGIFSAMCEPSVEKVYLGQGDLAPSNKVANDRPAALIIEAATRTAFAGNRSSIWPTLTLAYEARGVNSGSRIARKVKTIHQQRAAHADGVVIRLAFQRNKKHKPRDEVRFGQIRPDVAMVCQTPDAQCSTLRGWHAEGWQSKDTG
ncbi:hypothetical protein BDU57DRAFT_526675 [Ampelomyces quisqualis]|uniref:Uncharacterized protein n=1 Tax=Ampelomyces quisqualis TaxID=50730 RepID=A0A6A5R7U4_AMPQU|nr:hypothetical protein BDU57DRAFT_526675 [Ampelomyces quisqualis]